MFCRLLDISRLKNLIFEAHDRRLAKTEKEYLPLILPSTRAGDQIIFLAGGHTPYNAGRAAAYRSNGSWWVISMCMVSCLGKLGKRTCVSRCSFLDQGLSEYPGQDMLTNKNTHVGATIAEPLQRHGNYDTIEGSDSRYSSPSSSSLIVSSKPHSASTTYSISPVGTSQSMSLSV